MQQVIQQFMPQIIRSEEAIKQQNQIYKSKVKECQSLKKEIMEIREQTVELSSQNVKYFEEKQQDKE